jgi:hypothetical protein
MIFSFICEEEEEGGDVPTPQNIHLAYAEVTEPQVA